MLLRQEFEHRVLLLNNAGVQELTRRLVGLFKWMNDQPRIKKILDELKARSPLTPVINSADPNRYKKVARSATSPEELVAVGLYMIEACGWETGGDSFTPLHQIATIYGLQTSPMAQKPENFADAAMKRYVEPFLDFVRRQMPREINPTEELAMPIQKHFVLSVFVSHSSKDEKLAAALVDLFRNALNIPASEIRCTSVNGYRLPIGTPTEQRLREEVHQARAFIGLITASSIESAYVMFELGARWGAGLHLAPLLGAGADASFLRGPLSSLNALNCEDAAQVHQLIDDLARILDVGGRTSPAAYQGYVERLIEISKSRTPNEKKATENPAVLITAQSENSLKIFKLDEVSKKALQFFCDRNNVVTIQELASHLSCINSKAQFICDGLSSKKFISVTGIPNVDPRWDSFSDNSGYEITSDGRAFCFTGNQ